MSITLGKVIELVDEIKPNDFSVQAKTAWINECEGMVQTEIWLVAVEEVISYSYEENKDTQLLVEAPHSKIYEAYLTARIDYANGEYKKYQNTMQMFNQWYREYMRWYAMRYRPADRNEEPWKGYYFTVYGIAVKHGYTGTEEEFLQSIKGEKGDIGETGPVGPKGEKGDTGNTGATGKSAYAYAQDAGYMGTEEEFGIKQATDFIDWFGKGIAINEGDDLDEYKTHGKYYCSSESRARTLLNCPTITNFCMYVFDRTGYKSQLIIGLDGKMYIRSSSSTAWRPWVAYTTSAEIEALTRQIKNEISEEIDIFRYVFEENVVLENDEIFVESVVEPYTVETGFLPVADDPYYVTVNGVEYHPCSGAQTRQDQAGSAGSAGWFPDL